MTLAPSPVYIAAPFAGDVDVNVQRACQLSMLAVKIGLAPIVVHPGIAAGAYGDDGSPSERERGLRAVCALVDLVAEHRYGELWVLLRDDGSMSPGTQREFERFKKTRWWCFGSAVVAGKDIADHYIVAATWNGWLARAGVSCLKPPGATSVIEKSQVAAEKSQAD